MSNDQETENDKNDDIDNNDRAPQKCAKCKHLIGHKATSNQSSKITSAAVLKPQISILQRNANGINRESQILKDLAEKHKVDVIAIEETCLLPRDKTSTLTNYHPVHRD